MLATVSVSCPQLAPVRMTWRGSPGLRRKQKKADGSDWSTKAPV